MDLINNTMYKEFHLKMFPIAEIFLFVLILGIFLMYLLSMLGNLIIIAVVYSAPRLRTPMYFFLVNLSIQDVASASSILPKLLAIEITGETYISFLGCFTQMFVYAACMDAEFFLLASMALDRYFAICVPLKYSIIMNKKVCTVLVLISWVAGSLNSLLYVSLVSHLSFCDLKDINHFYCDIKALMRVSCSEVTYINNVILLEGCILGFLPFAMILTSYGFIISTILKIKTMAGRLKIFSRCSSHLTVVFLFCGTSLSVYMKPDSESSVQSDMMLSLLYVAVVPTLNPLVYSLRNKEVLHVLKYWRKSKSIS